MSCEIRIEGENKKPVKWVKSFSFKITETKRKDGSFVYGITASKADFSNLQLQIKNTIKFLIKNENDLKKIFGKSNIKSQTLDFGINKRNVAAQFDLFPKELIKCAAKLNLNIELSQYATE